MLNSLSLLKAIKNKALRTLFLKWKFKKHNNRLGEFYAFGNDRFFIYEVNGMYLPSSLLCWHLSYDDYYNEAKEISLRHYTPSAGDVIIDLGAGIGEEAIVYSRLVGVTGKVICIEPNPKAYEVLLKIIQLNKLSNVVALNCALFDKNETILFHDEPSYLSAGLNSKTKNSTAYPITSRRLDTILKELNISQINFLKANIEGAERYLIDESLKEHWESIQNVAIATHNFRYHNEPEKNEFFLTRDLILSFLKQDFVTVSGADEKSYLDNWVYGTRNNPG